MKTKIIILLLVLVSSARATLIDLTPGGFNGNNPPQVVTDWINTYFPPDQPPLVLNPPWQAFTVTGLGTPNGTISWDLSQSHTTFQWLFVYGQNENGIWFGNFYEVTPDSWIRGDGTITIDGIVRIDLLVEYGFTYRSRQTLAHFSFSESAYSCLNTRHNGVETPSSRFIRPASQP